MNGVCPECLSRPVMDGCRCCEECWYAPTWDKHEYASRPKPKMTVEELLKAEPLAFNVECPICAAPANRPCASRSVPHRPRVYAAVAPAFNEERTS